MRCASLSPPRLSLRGAQKGGPQESGLAPRGSPRALAAPPRVGPGEAVPGSAVAGSSSLGAAPSLVPQTLPSVPGDGARSPQSPSPQPRARAGLPLFKLLFPPAQAAALPQSLVHSGSQAPPTPRPEAIRSRPSVHL